jgi:hypothetical protein
MNIHNNLGHLLRMKFTCLSCNWFFLTDYYY